MPWQDADLPGLGLTAGQCAAAVRWVGGRGEHAAAEVAVARALRTGAIPLRIAAQLIMVARPASSWVYRWVAAHRDRMPGGTPACAGSSAPD